MTVGFGSFSAPTRRFGGVTFNQGPQQSDWGRYLSTLTNQKDIDQLGLGLTEEAANKDDAYSRWIASLANVLPPAAIRALRANRAGIDAGYAQARATTPDPLRYAQYLAGIDAKNTWNELTPYEGFRQNPYFGVRYR